LPYPNFIYVIFLTYLLRLFYSILLVTRWRSSGKSGSQQEIKAIYPSTLRMMCAVLFSVICNYYYYYCYFGLHAAVASACVCVCVCVCTQSMSYLTLYWIFHCRTVYASNMNTGDQSLGQRVRSLPAPCLRQCVLPVRASVPLRTRHSTDEKEDYFL